MTIKDIINNFIETDVDDLQEEGNMALELCDQENDYHITSYWINGTYENVTLFINNNYSEELYNTLLEMYPHDLEALKDKVKRVYGNYTSERLAIEILASILLMEYQNYFQWYSIYGTEEDDMIDFKKYNILNALTNTEEFPIKKREDIIASMYGLNDTVQPSDLYDIFAHYSDDLAFREESLIDDTHEPIFTPDVFLVAAVVSRYKNYIDMSKITNSDYAFKFLEISNYDNSEIRELLILNYAIDDYFNRFKEPPKSLPIHNDMITADIVNIDCSNKYLIKFKIMGIKNKITAWDNISEIIYDIPQTAEELQQFIIQIAIDFKRDLNGLEKVRNKDILAIEGKYPNKYSASHGLNFAKNINVHYKDKRKNDIKRTMKCNYSLALAEKQSLYLIKKSLRYSIVNPVISSSFGIDSVTTLHLLRRVNKHNYNIVFNNSLVEYPDLIKYKNELCTDWNLNTKLIETQPIESYWNLLEENGWNFNRKGSRKNGKSNSEVCCAKIKHVPFYNLIDEFIYQNNPIEVNYTGLRANESRSREQSAKRDNVVYYSKSWKTIRVNPITFFSDEMVWEYQRKYNMPYCEVYDKVVYYEDVYEKIEENEYHKIYYKPRIGCWCCLLNKSRGYLHFLRKFYTKQYLFLMITKGLAKDLFIPGAKKLGIISDYITVQNNVTSQISLFDCEEKTVSEEMISCEDIINRYSLEDMESLIMKRPCKFLA